MQEIFSDCGNVVMKRSDKDGLSSYAHYSVCDKYRYHLTRRWSATGKGFIAFLMLNPSTATELENDPTVERCERRARALGYDGFVVLNLFAIRATDPKVMLSDESPVGEYNDSFIQKAVESGMPIVCAWGNHGAHLERSRHVKKLLEMRMKDWYWNDVFFLKMNGSGEPAHPLYLSYTEELKEWRLY